MSNTGLPHPAPDPLETLALLERCLAEIDQLGMAGAGAQLSQAIETFRAELQARSHSSSQV